MKNYRRFLWSVGSLAGIAMLALPVPAQESHAFQGRFSVGYRFVDVGGTETKYKEDLNLDEGARLFGLNFDYVPARDGEENGIGQRVDRVQLDVTNFGGDPFEGFRFSVQKYGNYDFRYHRTKSTYFYQDIILPLELSTPSLTNGGDFHTFDFDRVRDVASFNLHLSPKAKLTVGLERFTKRGDSTTTLDVSRDEFELDRPIEESYDEFHIGFQYSWPKVTLILEERHRDYENDVELFLPGFSLGEDPADATTLDFFFLDQPYAFESDQHTVRLNARPSDRLLVRASAIVQTLDLDARASETSQGTAFNGQPFTTDFTGGGEIERDTELLDVDFSYLIHHRLALIGGVRQHHLDQSGRFNFEGNGNRSVWDVETTGYELGVEGHLSPKVTVSAGLRFESRDVETDPVTDGSSLAPERQSTDQDGFFGSVHWRPSSRASFDAEFETSSFDQPFTLSSPTDRERLSFSGKLKGKKGLYARGSYVSYRFDNDESGWSADRDELTVRVGWRQQGLHLNAGYSLIETDRAIDQSVTTLPGFGGGVTFLYPILFQSDADFFEGRLRYQASDRITLGGEARFYDNSGTFGIRRDDLRGWVECGFGTGYLLHLGYRTLDYDEERFDFDDYDADIVEVSIGYRW